MPRRELEANDGLAVWFDWVQNIFWFPTVLAFVAATFAYVINPSYIAAMATGILLCSLPPFVIKKMKQPDWITLDPDELLVDIDPRESIETTS